MGLFDALDDPPLRPAQRRAQQRFRPLFTRPTDWRPYDALPELGGLVALDAETSDPGLAVGNGSSWPHTEGFVCGWAISHEHGDFYLPTRHSEGNTDPEKVTRWLSAQAKKPGVTFIYANAPYDLGWLLRDNIDPVNLPIDVQAMAALLDEYRFSYSLDALAADYLGERKGDKAFIDACTQGGLREPKSNMALVPAWIAEPYAVQDAKLTRALYHKMMPEIEAEGLQRVHELERECALVARDMKRRGVRVDLDRAQREMRRFEILRDQHMAIVRDLTGVACSPTDNVSLAKALKVENPAMQLPTTTAGRDSIRKEVMDSLKSPVADAINAARRYEKAINTFFKGHILGHAVKGRVHAEFHSTRRSSPEEDGGLNGTVTGRFATTNPNLGNVPTRDPGIGDAVRGCFLPEEGEAWAKLDYSSQEPRLTVHFAMLARLAGAQAMVDRYIANPKLDLHQETADAMGIPKQRNLAKTINLGIAYGMGGGKLCHQLGLPTEMRTHRQSGKRYEAAGMEGQRLLDLHLARMPFIKAFQQLAQKRAEERGYITMIDGRRGRFKKHGDEWMETHKAANKVIQGSAAAQMKTALCLLKRASIPILVTVYDEADLSVPLGEAGDRLIAQVKEIMEGAIPLKVPVVAEAKIGANWGEVR